jgi:hypothetical protein
MRCIQRRKLTLLVLTCVLVLGAFGDKGYAPIRELPPNGELSVAYRQFQDGKLSKTVHHLTLSCIDGSCSLTTLTLNQCMILGGVKAFYPKVQRTSTSEGNLSVIVRDNNLVVKEKLEGTEFTYNFKYSTTKKRPGVLGPENFFGHLTAFSGAAVKYSTLLDKVISWECVPLKGISPTIEAGCKIVLDGVP